MKKLISLLALSTSMAVIAAEPAELDNDGGALAQQAAILNQLQPQLANLTNPNGGALVASSTNNMPVNYLNGVNSHLKPKEAKGAALSYEWMNKNDMPGRGDAGAVMFQYGASMPTLVCAPLYACAIRLEPGETMIQMDTGDAVRWKITPSLSGSGENATTYLIVKATDSGLTTNLTVTTDRRIYVIKLVSRIDDWMPLVAFNYPEDQQRAMERYQAQIKAVRDATIMSDGGNVSTLDFGFKMRGDNPSWKPLRVYTDGAKTFIQFPKKVSSSNQELPTLLSVGSDDKEQLINYRLIGDRFVVDSVIDRAMLITGVGRKQVKVDIIRDERGN
ncbi:P-type conjugative transfer protein TrbG [Acinetobacter baumannii]|uniref:P-type conjugative transfer protein TrbG n=1 Tax=Acinetobacter baumannii TaxID=470 RepID=UPI00387DC8D6